MSKPVIKHPIRFNGVVTTQDAILFFDPHKADCCDSGGRELPYLNLGTLDPAMPLGGKDFWVHEKLLPSIPSSSIEDKVRVLVTFNTSSSFYEGHGHHHSSRTFPHYVLLGLEVLGPEKN